MSFDVTTRMRLASQDLPIRPNLVLQIDGLEKLYGAVEILEIAKVGGFVIGDGTTIGGLAEIENSDSLITFDGTTNSIRQNLDPDRGIGSSISSFKITLIDKNEEISELVSPGFELTDILARKARVWYGFSDNTAYPDDYIILFRGVIDQVESKPGAVTLNITHPDKKKEQDIFPVVNTALDGAITDSDTTLTVDSTANILAPVTGPDATIDDDFESYVRIDDEIIQFTGISGSDLTGLVRGAFGTTAAAHSDEAAVDTIYRIKGNIIDMALKLMASGNQGPYLEDAPIQSFVCVVGEGMIDNAIYFDGVDAARELGARIGSFVTVTGATNAANNVTLEPITDVQTSDNGSYIVLGGASLVLEDTTSAVIDFRSEYDVWPDGLRMGDDEIDIAEHELLKTRFLSSFDYDFRLKDTINGKEFLEQEIYVPAACFSVPRKATASVGFHIGPVPGDETKSFDKDNVANAKNLKIKRSISRNFYNEIVYKFEESDIEADKFLRGEITINATAQTQIPKKKTFTIESRGLRDSLSGSNIAIQASNRRLTRYAFAAESIDSMILFFRDSFNLEIGDIIIFDGTELELPDSQKGGRGFGPRLMEIVNTNINLKTGEYKVNVVDTNYDLSARYGLISPASKIEGTGATTTTFKITDSFANQLASEGLKWERYVNSPVEVRVRSADFTTRNDTAQILSVSGNTITLASALSFTPLTDDVMELSTYNDESSEIKLRYAFMTDNAAFDDGAIQYQML